MSSIEEKVIDKIRSRAERGWTKYGTTMEREDLSFLEWMVHLQEELMDATIYIQKIINDHNRNLISVCYDDALDTQSNTLYIEEE